MSSPEFHLLDSQKEAIIHLVKTLGYVQSDIKFEPKPYLADSSITADTLYLKNNRNFCAQFIWFGDKLEMLIYPSKLGFHYTKAVYQHWTEGLILLKQWLNNIEGILQRMQKNDFQMHEFEIAPNVQSGTMKISFRQSEYCFELYDDKKCKKISYTPGETSKIEVVESPILSEFDYLAKWLSRLKYKLNADKTAGIPVQKNVSEPKHDIPNPGLRRFGTEQLTRIINEIQYIRAQLVKFKLQRLATSEQVESANRELDYLIDAMNRVTPLDWSYIAATALNIIANTLKVNVMQEEELFKNIKQFIQHLPLSFKPRIIFLPEEKIAEPSLQYQNASPQQEKNKPAPTFI